ncbi:E3 ubiquitin-protein ligase RNF103 isoform X4 [Alligator mississippiensis]|uniref:E3 ubiquitin-protein ligase RNF103 isoform X4 n=1 Tax=Alligator mississippiensis TaxID=8496 RepID=UPI0009076F4E|nr:E3 ubiquitin-protein ligase RNF103 isoform X4 [Alligator mississippiensis]
MWLRLFFLLLYFLVLFVLARVFEAVVWYETGFLATQLVDPVTLSFKKLKTILEGRGLGYSGLPDKKDVRELVEKSGDLMEGELYSALKEEEASESVSSTNFSGEMHFYELVEDTKDGIWLVQILQEKRLGEIHINYVSPTNQHLQGKSDAERIQWAQN